jgi:hypothetical protein
MRKRRQEKRGDSRDGRRSICQAARRGMLPLSLVVFASIGEAGPAAKHAACSAFVLGADGVWGGDDAFMTDSSEFWLRRLTTDSQARRMRERRYRLMVTPVTRVDLDQVLASSRFSELRSSKRREVPDEPKAIIGYRPAIRRRPYW